jgi:hypothetical protein
VKETDSLNLSDKFLLESYRIAVELKLDKAFVELLEKELIRRGIAFEQPLKDKQED